MPGPPTRSALGCLKATSPVLVVVLQLSFLAAGWGSYRFSCRKWRHPAWRFHWVLLGTWLSRPSPHDATDLAPEGGRAEQ